MSSIVSNFGTARTDASLSEMSLVSSAQRTFCTSFSEYETPRMSPVELQDDPDDKKNEPECVTQDYKYVAVSQSSSTIQDKATTELEHKFLVGIKSDSCMSQQSKAISVFMEDVFKVQQQQQQQQSLKQTQGEPNLVFTGDRSSGNSTEFYTVPSIPKKVEAESVRKTGEYKFLEAFLSRCRQLEAPTSLAETKHKIIENLSYMTSDRLFSKSSRRSMSNDNYHQHKLHQKPSLQSQKSRRSWRSPSIDSILRIDYELQPLNLMLSRLLAEFKAIELKSKLESVGAKSLSSRSSGTPSGSHLFKSFKSVAVGNDSVIPLNKDYQDYLKYKNERDSFIKSLKERYGLFSPSNLEELRSTLKTLTEQFTQTTTPSSKSHDYDKDYRNLYIPLTRMRPSEKRNYSPSRCCRRHQNRLLHSRSDHHNRNKTSPERDRLRKNHFGRSILDEITRIDEQCAKQRELEEAEERRKLGDAPTGDPPPVQHLLMPQDFNLSEDGEDSIAQIPLGTLEDEDCSDVRSTELDVGVTNQEEEVRWEGSGS